MENIQTITLDWLSIYTIGKIKDSGGFVFIKEPYNTRHFKDVFKIYFKNLLIGTATARPHSKIINPLAVIVKFENDILYSKSAKYFIQKFLKSTQLLFKSITRADIARDFHTFINDLNPQRFIQDFFKMRYLKNGRGKFQTIGEQKRINVYDYLKFGSRSTGRIIYLYNKSKELKEVKNKPHIIDFWKRNGLIPEKTVWRLEFSFKGTSNKMIDTITGLITKISWQDLFNIKLLTEILTAAINQLFSFKINDDTKNKTRMKDVQLFHSHDNGIKLQKLPDREDPTKIFKTILRTLTTDYYTNGNYTEPELKNLYNTIIDIANRHKLLQYLNKTLQFQPAKLSHIN
jgi:hypothetical protein